MPISKFVRLAAVAVLAAVPVAAMAAASTQKGEVSVAQVMEMLGQTKDNPTARQVLTAYLAGLGEAASSLIDAAGGSAVTCKRSLSLDDKAARRALQAVDRKRWQETAATPLIVRGMIERAGCAPKG